ncbi:MAG: hypothetical protein NZN28_13590, partial [Meiothermus sp.]|uniref:hypothetical protein n=1 Tax=Meiothermus sp. TaxID=1955249 RepID=UPI0025CF2B98
MHGIVVVGAPNLDSVINNLLAGDGTTGNVKRISKSLDKALDACIRTEARLRAALANLSAVKPTAEVALEKVIAAIRDNDDAHLIAYGCASTWDSFSHLNEARHRAERVVLSNRMASPGRGLVKLTLRKIELLARKLTWMSEAVGSLGRAEALAIMLAMLVRLL